MKIKLLLLLCCPFSLTQRQMMCSCASRRLTAATHALGCVGKPCRSTGNLLIVAKTLNHCHGRIIFAIAPSQLSPPQLTPTRNQLPPTTIVGCPFSSYRIRLDDTVAPPGRTIATI
eukprot:3940660-Rhodomonas_salina.2